MAIEKSDIPQIIAFLSEERLNVLRDLTGSDEDAIELHQQTLAFGTLLMNVIAIAEIALRNTVYDNLCLHFGVKNWLSQPPVPFQWKPPENQNIRKAIDSAKRAKYSKLSQEEKARFDQIAYPQGRPPGISHLQRAKDRRQKIVIPEGSVVAELTFHFWKRLYGPDYEQTLWRTTLKKTFPNKKISRAAVAAKLEDIYQARNRLAHHEPVLHKRLTDTLDSIQFLAANLCASSSDEETALARLISNDLDIVKKSASELHKKLDSYRSTSSP